MVQEIELDAEEQPTTGDCARGRALGGEVGEGLPNTDVTMSSRPIRLVGLPPRQWYTGRAVSRVGGLGIGLMLGGGRLRQGSWWALLSVLASGCTEADPGYSGTGSGEVSSSVSSPMMTGPTVDAVTSSEATTSSSVDPGSSGSETGSTGTALTDEPADGTSSGSTLEDSDSTSSSGESTSGYSVEPPDCQEPVRVLTGSEQLWDVEILGDEALIAAQTGTRTSLTRLDDRGALIRTSSMQDAREILSLDMEIFSGALLVAYEAPVAGGSDSFLAHGAQLSSEDERLNPEGEALGHTPRFAVAEPLTDGETLFIGFVQEENRVRLLKYTSDWVLQGDPASTVSSESSIVLRQLTHGSVRAEIFALAEGVGDSVAVFGVDNATRGVISLASRHAVMVDTSQGARLVSVDEALASVQMTEFAGTTPRPAVSKATIDAGLEDATCTRLDAIARDDEIVAVVACDEAGQTTLRGLTLSPDLGVAPGPIVDILGETMAIDQFQLFHLAERDYVTWIADADLWVAPICFE